MNTPDMNQETGLGRAVVVTGGSSGIGKAIADAFRDNGDRVEVLDRAEGNGAIRVDVADEASVQAAFTEARKRLGPGTFLHEVQQSKIHSLIGGHFFGLRRYWQGSQPLQPTHLLLTPINDKGQTFIDLR